MVRVAGARISCRNQMRAAIVNDPAARLELASRPAPQPGPGEIVVSVQCTSINPVDVYVATGQYTMGHLGYPLTPGHDFAGIVEQVGDQVSRFAPGDRVLGMWSKDIYGDGSWAELVTIPEEGLVAPWPNALEPAHAAALPLASLTAALAVDFVAPAAGEPVVVIGAAGAVGRYAVQLAAQRGARVIATARPGSEPAALELGARTTIDPAGDLTSQLRLALPGGVPALIDLVSGRRTLAGIAELVPAGGRIVSARFAADQEALAARQIRALNVRTYDAHGAMLAELARAAAAGVLTVALDDVVGFDELPSAVAQLATGDRVGKVVANLT
jgi:NADPH:quinone reductase-like Zn-dependent oxidoreductase